MANNTPRPINYSNILKGDKVQIEYMDRDTRVICEATAFNRNYANEWVTEQGVPIYSGYPGTTYSLLERPGPVLPTKPGSIIRIDKYFDDGRDDMQYPDKDTYAILDGDDDWIVVVDEYHRYVEPGDIHEWSPVTVFIEKDDEEL